MSSRPTIPASGPAARFSGRGLIGIEERPVPRPGPSELLLAVKSNGLCGTEREQFHRGSLVTPGHEAAGIVVAAGEATTTSLDTAGVVYLMDYCGTCRSCRIGATNQCLAKRADMGFTSDGGYGSYELVHETNFFPIDGRIPVADGPLLLDVMGTSSHALARARLVHPDPRSLLVVGAGPVGLGVAAMAHLVAPELTVYISDTVPYRLELAGRLGAAGLDIRDSSVAVELAAKGAREVDIVVDTSGRQAARQAALALLAKRGVLICVGHGEGLNLTVTPDLIAPERAVLGSEYFRYDEMAPNLQLLVANHPYLNQIITHRFALPDIEAAFRLFFGGDSGKVLIEQ